MPLRVKILLVAMVAAMVAIAIYTVNNSVTGTESASQSAPNSVDRLIPESGTKVLSQSTVGVDLKAGYDAYLVVGIDPVTRKGGVAIRNNATEADQDGLLRTPSQGVIEYDPGPGKRVERLNTPKSCVDAWIWKIEDGPDTAQQFEWCFEVS